jgi:dCTP diphosphatase
MLGDVSDLIELRDRLREFTDERDWAQFHDPKSLILALAGELGELAELFQWLPAGEAAERASAEPLRSRAGEEIADVLLYLIRLADVLGLDLAEVAGRKLAASHDRFPADEHRSNAPTKY